MSYARRPTVAYPHAITTFSPSFTTLDTRTAINTGAAWPTSNLAIYVPIRIPVSVVVVKLALPVGTSSGNCDLGIYNAAGTRLVSTGSQALSGSATEFVVDVTDTTLAPGLYYLAACIDNTTATVPRVGSSAPIPAANGVLTEALGSVTLPATATWTVNQTLAYQPLLVALTETTVA